MKGPSPSHLVRRLQGAADLAGDADGRATATELANVGGAVRRDPVVGREPGLFAPDARAAVLEEAVRSTAERGPVTTLAEPLRKLPEPLRRLALELDSLWGNADGHVSVAEIDRVARYTLAALPFFMKEASRLIELAEYLGLDAGQKAAPGVLSLRLAVAEVDRRDGASASEFRRHFDEAVRVSDVAGLPELLRDAGHHSPRWHSLSVLEHSAVAVDAASKLASAVSVDWRAAGGTMLVHDIGKILERRTKEDGAGALKGFSFTNHEADGARWLEERGLPEDVVFHVRHHADLRALSADEMEALMGTRERLQQGLLVYVADQVAKGIEPAQLASFDEQAPKIAELSARCGIDAAALFEARRALVMEHFGVDVGVPD